MIKKKNDQLKIHTNVSKKCQSLKHDYKFQNVTNFHLLLISSEKIIKL